MLWHDSFITILNTRYVSLSLSLYIYLILYLILFLHIVSYSLTYPVIHDCNESSLDIYRVVSLLLPLTIDTNPIGIALAENKVIVYARQQDI